MHRSKFTAAALAVLMALSAGLVFFVGEAAAAEWHTYEGDIHPGHAYGLEVPADAAAIEIGYAGEGAAKLAVFDPAGEMVAFYELSQSPSKATIVQPTEGRYVVYVYEVAQGALDVRVNAEEAPALSLQKIPLAREDVVLTQVDAPAAMDEVVTAKLALTPVFVTLLYEGSAQDLDATVSSSRGAVAIVQDETATAFSPGVWASQTGTRTSDAANLAAGAYTVAVQAASFEGTMVLTSLALDLTTEVPVDEEPPVVVPPVQEADPALFALVEHEAIAVQLAAGTLVVADAHYLQHEAEKAAQDDDAEHHHPRHERSQYYSSARLRVYTPGDELLGVVTLDRKTPMATIDIPADGEYVIYTHRATGDLLAKMENTTVAPDTRVLELSETVVEFDTSSFLGDSYTEEFTLEHVPVSMTFWARGGLATWEEASVTNAKGVVADSHSLAHFAGINAGSYYVDDEMFAAGEHTFEASGLLGESRYELRVLHYLREAAEVVEEVVVEEPAPEPASEEPGEPEDDRTFFDEVRELLPF